MEQTTMKSDFKVTLADNGFIVDRAETETTDRSIDLYVTPSVSKPRLEDMLSDLIESVNGENGCLAPAYHITIEVTPIKE